MKKLDLKELKKMDLKEHYYGFIRHRSYRWKSLEDKSETDPWVIDHLMPKLEKELGVKWFLAGKNLLHLQGEIILRDGNDQNIFKDNEIIDSLKKMYPLLDSDDIGYKPENLKRIISKKYVYDGIWALSCEKIIERGRIVGKKFGL